MLANGLSLLRVLLAPAVVYGLQRTPAGADTLTLSLMLAAGATDLLDGVAARRLGQTSRLGRILDPLADKAFIGCVGAGLVLWRDFPLWLLGMQVLRDVAIVGAGSLLLRSRDVVIGASLTGKAATWAMSLTILAWTLAAPAALRVALQTVTAALLLLSAAGYLRQLRRCLDDAGA